MIFDGVTGVTSSVDINLSNSEDFDLNKDNFTSGIEFSPTETFSGDAV